MKNIAAADDDDSGWKTVAEAIAGATSDAADEGPRVLHYDEYCDKATKQILNRFMFEAHPGWSGCL
eukprot:5228704-Pyramimonas_sp.AAC.1